MEILVVKVVPGSRNKEPELFKQVQSMLAHYKNLNGQGKFAVDKTQLRRAGFRSLLCVCEGTPY